MSVRQRLAASRLTPFSQRLFAVAPFAIADDRLLDDQLAVHERLARAERGVGNERAVHRTVGDADRDGLERGIVAAEGGGAAVGLGEGEAPALDRAAEEDVDECHPTSANKVASRNP